MIRRQEEARIEAEIRRPTIGSTIGEPPSEDEGAGDDHADRAERVGEAVAQHPLEVDVLALAAGEDQGRGEVAGETEQAEAEDAAAVDRGRVAEPADAAQATATRRRRAAAR